LRRRWKGASELPSYSIFSAGKHDSFCPAKPSREF